MCLKKSRLLLLQQITLVLLISSDEVASKNSAQLLSIVNALDRQLQAELHVYVELSSSSTALSGQMQMLLHTAQLPRLIVRCTESGQALYKTFKSKALTVVSLGGAADVTASVETVSRILWKLHFLDVLFVWRTPPAPHELRQLFAHCWTHGFTNVLAYASGTLYTYHPFPRISVVRLPQLSAYHDKTPLRNFQRYQLRCPMLKSPPRCYQYKDSRGNVVNSGYFYQNVHSFIEHYNGTFVEALLPTSDVLLPEILQAFEARQIDLLPNMLFVHPNYSHSIVLRHLHVYIMAPHAKPIGSYLYFVKPFGRWLWIIVSLVICYASLAMTLIYWRQEHLLDLSFSFLQVLSTVLYLPNSYRARRTREQLLLFALLLMSGFILTNYYLSNLSSMLTLKLYEPQINTIADIAHTNLYLPQTEMDVIHAHIISVPAIALDRMIPSSPTTVNNLRRDLNNSYLISGAEDKIKFYMYQQKFLKIPYFKLINEILYSMPLFIPLPHGSPFLQLLNTYLRRISETGLLQKTLRDSAEDGIRGNEIRFFKSEDTYDAVLNLGHFRVPLVMWAMGLTCALGCFIFEHIHFRLLRNKRKLRCCNVCVNLSK